MNATGRGAPRRANDDYPTPRWVIDYMLEVAKDQVGVGGDWIEPSAGEGRIIKRATELRMCNSFSAVEINPKYAETLGQLTSSYMIGNFLDLEPAPVKYKLAITNPPFSLFFPFLKKCLQIADHVILLAPVTVRGTGIKEGRHDFLRQCYPDEYVLPHRPRFVGKGTDSVDIAIYHWDANNLKPWGTSQLLPSLSIQERREE